MGIGKVGLASDVFSCAICTQPSSIGAAVENDRSFRCQQGSALRGDSARDRRHSSCCASWRGTYTPVSGLIGQALSLAWCLYFQQYYDKGCSTEVPERSYMSSRPRWLPNIIPGFKSFLWIFQVINDVQHGEQPHKAYPRRNSGTASDSDGCRECKRRGYVAGQ